MAETSAGTAPLPLLGKLLAPGILLWTAFYFVAFPILVAMRRGGLQLGYWTYNAGLGAVSYFDVGFARRALQGTLLHPWGADPMAAAVGFQIVTYAAFTAAGVYLCCRVGGMSRQLMLGAVLVAILARLGNDVGRTDAAVMMCGLLAAWATKEARWSVAALALSIALLFHETGLIVLGPMLAGVAWASGSWRRWRSSSAAGGAVILLCALLAYGLSFGPPAHLQATGRRVHALFLSPGYADLAVFANFTGPRGLAASVCNNMINPAYPARVASGVAVCLLLTIGLQPRRWRVAAAVWLPAYLFLCAVSTDIGRWSLLAAFSLFALTTADEAASGGNPGLREIALVLAACGLMTVALDFRSVVFAPIPLLNDYVQAHGMKSPEPLDAITTCDPAWRSVIGV